MLTKIKPYLDFLKEYLPIISLLPFIAGGLWQVLELAFISPSYIRLFSPTQLIADGLLILFVVLILGGTSWYGIKRFKNYSFDFKKVKENSFWDIIKVIIGIGVGISFVLFYLWDAFYSMVNMKANIGLMELTMVIFIFPIFIYFVLEVLLLITALILKVLDLEFNINERLKSILLNIILGVIIITLIFTPIYIIPFFHNKYYFPNDLINLKRLIKAHSKEKNTSIDSIKVLYVNDKYIFLENKDGVEILKFEELFEDPIIKVKKVQ